MYIFPQHLSMYIYISICPRRKGGSTILSVCTRVHIYQPFSSPSVLLSEEGKEKNKTKQKVKEGRKIEDSVCHFANLPTSEPAKNYFYFYHYHYSGRTIQPQNPRFLVRLPKEKETKRGRHGSHCPLPSSLPGPLDRPIRCRCGFVPSLRLRALVRRQREAGSRLLRFAHGVRACGIQGPRDGLARDSVARHPQRHRDVCPDVSAEVVGGCREA